jgi:hypothetical protein
LLASRHAADEGKRIALPHPVAAGFVEDLREAACGNGEDAARELAFLDRAARVIQPRHAQRRRPPVDRDQVH